MWVAPVELRAEYGTEIIEFVVFGTVGDGSCLFTAGDLMSKSMSACYQRGGPNYPETITRLLPSGNLPPCREAKYVEAKAKWSQSQALRSLASTSKHMFAEAGPAFIKSFAMLRVSMGLERPVEDVTEWDETEGVTVDGGAGSGAFVFLNSAATGHVTVGVETDRSAHDTQLRIHSTAFQKLELPVATRMSNMAALFVAGSSGIRNVFMFDGASETSLDPVLSEHMQVIRNLMLDAGVWSFLSTKLNVSLMKRYAEIDKDISKLLEQFQCYRLKGKKVSRHANLTPWLWVRHESARTSTPTAGRVLSLVKAALENGNDTITFGTSPSSRPSSPPCPYHHHQREGEREGGRGRERDTNHHVLTFLQNFLMRRWKTCPACLTVRAVTYGWEPEWWTAEPACASKVGMKLNGPVARE